MLHAWIFLIIVRVIFSPYEAKGGETRLIYEETEEFNLTRFSWYEVIAWEALGGYRKFGNI